MNRENGKSIRMLRDEHLEAVTGGQGISIVTKMPNYNGPKKHVPGSIAQGDTLDNTLTFDQLP